MLGLHCQRGCLRADFDQNLTPAGRVPSSWQREKGSPSISRELQGRKWTGKPNEAVTAREQARTAEWEHRKMPPKNKGQR